jgi:hypothetical protein
MKRLVFAAALFAVAWLLPSACALENDDDDSGGLDDDASLDDDDATPSWDQRCASLVGGIYEDCGFTLFDLSPDDALMQCENRLNVDWECVVTCWETHVDCDLWYDCVAAQCDIPAPDDDAAG